jgi:hypothetical protein
MDKDTLSRNKPARQSQNVVRGDHYVERGGGFIGYLRSGGVRENSPSHDNLRIGATVGIGRDALADF